MTTIRFGLEHTDLALVREWLASTYWSPGIGLDLVQKAAEHSSLVVGAFDVDTQVGYCRVVSDRVTFAWVADVFVADSHRGRGVGRLMVSSAMAHPEHQGLRRWLLATADAHGVYEGVGFGPLPDPTQWMVHFPTPPA